MRGGFSPTAQQWADRLGNLKRTGSGSWNGSCPLCGGRDRFHVKEGQGRALVGCRGCLDGQRDPARFGELMRAVWGHDPRPPPKQTKRSAPSRPPQDLRGFALQLWRSAGDVPAAPDTPARRWLAGTGDHGPLWPLEWPWEVPLPAAVRWTPSVWWNRSVGAFVAALAPWTAWRAAWPAVPEPCGVQVVYVQADGEPARDREGKNKRNYGQASGAVCLIGTAAAGESVQTCEGVADGLALAARSPRPAAVLVGTGGYRADATRQGLSDAAHVEIWTDQDGPGVAAATDLAFGLDLIGVPVTARNVTWGKDPAAAGGPFPLVDGALLEVEAARAAAADGLPLGEARRQVNALLMEAAALDAADAGAGGAS